jgi:hypothetical protein
MSLLLEKGVLCLQEAASNHIVDLRGRSEQYYAADPELAKLDLIFVLTRMQIRMRSYPRWYVAIHLFSGLKCFKFPSSFDLRRICGMLYEMCSLRALGTNWVGEGCHTGSRL